MSIKYELIIYWSDEDDSFVVEVPELPGWIETAGELGRPIPEPRGRLLYA